MPLINAEMARKLFMEEYGFEPKDINDLPNEHPKKTKKMKQHNKERIRAGGVT